MHRRAELNAYPGRNHRLKDLSPIDQWHVSQVVSVQMQEIEGDEIEVVLAPGYCLAQLAEIRNPCRACPRGRWP
ncbi:hypothetical protein RFM98_19405 [Mesorhizobium sp. VK9D]|nr:hypothetical protein [Mesorhizobium sp. VK9D]MDX8454935.1 hypothetical protein [Mesorhizobium sp. VK9D]